MTETLIKVLCIMFIENITHADYETKQLHGGDVGDIQLVTGIAKTPEGKELPFKVVLKIQKKWERDNDPYSWRREYDLYTSDLGTAFTGSFRWPTCYHGEIGENKTQLWLEYIDGCSGSGLTLSMYERAAEELGRFQGRICAEQPAFLQKLTNLSKADYAKNFYENYRSWDEVYNYIRSQDNEIPTHLCDMLINFDNNWDTVWDRIMKLPVVLCHRDFWVANIFYSNSNILLIDWDTAGWGYLGEDIASLIADESDPCYIVEYYQKCVPAYYKGFSEYADAPDISDNCVYELILAMYGYRLVGWYKYAKSPDEKAFHLNTLHKIYELK